MPNSLTDDTARPHTVLIVDDASGIREGLASVFEIEGYRVVAVPNGRAALDVLTTMHRRPDVVILDLVMPTMDGFKFREQQMKDPDLAAVPVIALTAHEGLRRHALDMGFAAAVQKPCEVGMLLSLVAHHCRRRAALRRA